VSPTPSHSPVAVMVTYFPRYSGRGEGRSLKVAQVSLGPKRSAVGKTTIKKRGIADVVIPRARKDEVLRDELLGAVSVLRDMDIEIMRAQLQLSSRCGPRP
jgi:hypothetical protein